MKRLLCAAMLSLLCVSTASAIEGYVVGDVELRAGPDPAYPAIAMLNDGTPVTIFGCVGNWSWCDVATPADRGWVPADFLQQEYQGQRVYVPEYGAVIGVPIVTFVFVSYWDTHYRNRPFYAQRERFVSVRPQLPPPRHQSRTAPPPPTGQAPAIAPTRPAGTPPPPPARVQSQPAQQQSQPASVPRTPPATSTTTNQPTPEPGRHPSSQATPTPSPSTSTATPARAPESQKGPTPQHEQRPAESKAPPKSAPPPKEQGKDKEKKDNKDNKDNKDQQS